METEVKRLYEGMFLVDSGIAASDWAGVIESVEKVLARAGAEVVSLQKWDERSLAYAVVGKSRGTYILTYFHADPGRISGIERDVQLSESLMRVLILRTDKMGHGDIDKKTPAQKVEEAVAAATAKAAAAESKVASEAAVESKVTAEAPTGEVKSVESAPVVSEQPEQSSVEVTESEKSQPPDSAESSDKSEP